MRDPASKKREVIRFVKPSHLPVRRTLQMPGIPRTMFYRLCHRYTSSGLLALNDRGNVWNRIPEEARDWIVQLVLEKPELLPRELAMRLTAGFYPY